MKTVSLLAILVCVNFAFADRIIMDFGAREARGRAEAILWRESDLTQQEAQTLMDVISHPHHEVSEFAFCVAVVRNADKLEKLHELSANVLKLKLKGAVLQMAEHIGRLQMPMTAETLTTELKNVKREHWSVPTAMDYYHDMLVYLLLRKARREGKAVVIPADVQFDIRQRKLLEYGFKQEKDAWKYLFGKIKERDGFEGKQHNEDYDLYNALSAYSNIFFDEAVTAIQSKDATPWTREILSLYLQNVFLRLDDGRREQVKALLKQLNLPIHFGFGVE
ncbi:MAG: hypothetical protein IKS67_13610 [Victivallales bacterium]|nr:hypothetical protein [Victivallales bacterium]